MSTSQKSIHKQGLNIQLTAYEILSAPEDANVPWSPWMAVATAHVYDADAVVPPLSPAQVVLAGETMRVVSRRAKGGTQAKALALALKNLLYALASDGFCDGADIKI